MQRSFSLVELIFVILLIGILSSIFIPRFVISRNEALITKLKMEITAIKAGIAAKYSQNLMNANNSCPELEGDNNEVFFEGVLSTPIKSTQFIKWSRSENNYSVIVASKKFEFIYDPDPSKNCPFECIDGECDIFQ